jgi:hypothetical protein
VYFVTRKLSVSLCVFVRRFSEAKAVRFIFECRTWMEEVCAGSMGFPSKRRDFEWRDNMIQLIHGGIQ